MSGLRNTALVKKREAAVAEILQEIADDDLSLAKNARKAARLDHVDEGMALLSKSDSELAALGWTREELRIAVDAKMPSKDAPAYLMRALDRVELRWRNGTGEKPGTQVMVAVVNNAPGFSKEDLEKAPVIDVSVTNG